MRKSTIFLLLILINISVTAQRKNEHNHNIQIDEAILQDFLIYLDSTLEKVNDTILIENDISIPYLNRIKVKYVPISSIYIWNMKNSYLSISKKMHFESDTSICISFDLNENTMKYEKKEKSPSSRSSSRIQGSPDYYVKFNCEIKNWELLDSKMVISQYAYRTESNWVVMDSTSVRQFIYTLQNVKKGRHIINSITTTGQVDSSWIKKEDLEFLISLIDSKEKSACIKMSDSSERSNWNDLSTIGAQVTQILNSHINGELYPYSLNCCPSENEKLKQEILIWWENQTK